MKTAITHNIIKKVCLVALISLGYFVDAQVVDAFSARYNQTINGNYTMIANNMLSRTPTLNYNGVAGNHNFTDNVYVDIDGVFDADGDTFDDTFNSSSANYLNPQPTLSCLTTSRVFLYWTAADKEPTSDPNSENQPNWNFNDVMLMLPGQTQYSTLTADEIIYRGRNFHVENDGYACFKDITNLVDGLASPYGKYQVANVEAKVGSLDGHNGGSIGTSGGWQIVFIYESPELTARTVSLFDGYAEVTNATNNFDIPFTGFKTVQTGNVDIDLMIGALEGDRDLSKDELQIKNTSGNFVPISTAQRASNNFFNSKITVGNTTFIDRDPVSQNTLGFDAGLFKLDNPGNSLVGNNQTSAILRLATDRENYSLYLVGFSVEVLAPNFDPILLVLDSGVSPAQPGSTLGFNFNIQNTGNDDADNVTIASTLPPSIANVTSVNLPTGVTYNFNPATNLLEFFVDNTVVEVGDSSLTVDFDIVLKDECFFLEDDCDLSFDLQFLATYNGVGNIIQQTTLSSSEVDICNVGNKQPLSIDIVQPTINWGNPVGDLDRSVPCSNPNALNNAQNLEPFTDICDIAITKTAGNFVEDPGSPGVGTYTNTWTFTDACGVTIADYVQVITVGTPYQPISITATQVDILCGGANTGSIDVTILGGIPPYVYSWTGPNGFSSNVEDISNLEAGLYTLSVTDDNPCAPNPTTIDVTITTLDSEDPVINAPDDYTIEGCGTSAISDLPFSTTETSVTLAQLQNALGGNGTASDNQAITSITYTDTSIGTCPIVVERTWTVTDDCGNTMSDIQTITIDDTTLPVLTIPADITLECSDFRRADPGLATATDNCGNVEVNFIDAFVETCGNSEIVTRTWSATDDCGNVTTADQIITFIDSTPPTLSIPADISLQCGDDSSPSNTGTATATDNCDDNVFIDFSDAVTGCGASQVITRTWSALDACGNTSVGTQTITFSGLGVPTLTTPVDISVECDESTDPSNTGTATTANICGTVAITFADSSVPACGNTETITRTWTATDNCGNILTDIQIITVIDSTLPTFTVPTNITIECDQDPLDLTLTGDVTDEADNCSIGLQATFADATINGTCPTLSTITRTWTLTDDCGNTASSVQTITVEDSTMPTFTVPVDITIECDQNPLDLTLTGDVTDEADNCSTGLQATFTDVSVNGTCASESVITRTWTLTDDCGNTASSVQTITVEDSTAPTFTVPVDVTIECDQNPLDLTVTGDVTDEADNCSTGLQATFTDVSVNGTCPTLSTVTRTWTLVDDCGNTTTSIQTITIEDNALPTFTVPADITIECDQNPLDLTLTGDVTDEADNCSTGLQATFTDTAVNGSCASESVITRTWTLTDDCGNAATSVQTITVEDSTAPTFTVPVNITIECDQNPLDLTLTGDVTDEADNCSTGLQATFTDTDVNGSCASESVITRTWTLTDDCGNAATSVQTITVEDSTAPTFTVPVNITIECDQNPLDLTVTGDVTDEADNCSTGLQATFTDVSVNGTCTSESVITRTWTLTDDCGNTASSVQTITVEDSTAPTFTVPADITIECDQNPLDLTVTGDVTDEADNCSTGLQATFTDVSVNGTCASESVITRTWTLTDDCGNTASSVQTITVEDSTAPTFTVPVDVTIECDQNPLDLIVTGDVTDEADNCSTGLQATFTDVSVNGTCPTLSTVTRTWTLVDDCGNTTTSIQTITIEDNALPTFTVPADVTIECDQNPLDLTLTGDVTDEADNCSTGLQATFTDDTFNGNCPTLFIIQRTWTLTDDCGNTTSSVQTITVEDNTIPTFTVPADITIECDQNPLDLTVTGDVTDEADNCSTGLQATFTDTAVNGSCASESVITRTWTLTDDCGNAATSVQTITVEDSTAPTFTVPVNITIECDQNPLDLTVTGDVTDEADNCSTGLQATFTDVSVNGTCTSESVITRTWTLTDDCGNTASSVQTITVEDSTAPTFTVPADITIECDQNPLDLTLTGDVTDEADNCSTGLQATFTDVSVNGTCASESVITRTWTLTDDCGNTASSVQTITVEDSTAPTFTVPVDVTIECDQNPLDLTVTGDVTDEADNCSTGLQATFTDVSVNGTCPTLSTVTRTWTLVDDCGNTTTSIQTITIEDNALPTFTVPADITIECDQNPLDLTLTGDVTDEADNCSTGLQATFTDTAVNGSCASESVITRTWTLTDDCGNAATSVQTITVEDSTAPTFTVPVNITIECDQNPLDLTVTGDVTDEADNCSTGLQATFTDVSVNGTCTSESVITRTWTLTDDCGNAATSVQTITVEDSTAPTFTVPADITIECDQNPLDLTLTGDVIDEADNCSTGLQATFTDQTANGNCANDSVIKRTWTVTDDCGNTTTSVQVITIEDSTAPTFTVPVDITIECDQNPLDLSITGDVTDEADNCSTGLQAIFTDTSLIGACTNEVTITRTWTLTDECGNRTTHIQVINVQDNTAPTFTVPADITIECDQDPTDVTITGDVTDEADNCSTGLQATFTDAVVNGTCPILSTITRTWTLTDDCNNTTTLVQTINVQDNTAPTFTVPADITIECDQDPTDVTITGDVIDEADNCSTGLQATFTDAVVNGTCPILSTITRTWTLTDDCNNTTTLVQTINVQDNTAPTFTVPADITIECDQDPTDVTITGDVTDEADNCSTGLQATFTDAVVNGTCPILSTITRTWTLTDDCNNTTTLVQTINVQDNTAPTFTVPADITIECDQDPTDVAITGDVIDEADNCSTGLQATFTDAVVNGTCPILSTITRTWTLTDDCNNTTTLVQTINVQDNTAPTFTVPADITIECDQDPTDVTITGDVIDEADNCSTGLQATFTDAVVNGTCPILSTITRTWTLTDDCNNTTTLVQTINVQDNTAPTFTVPADITIECDQDPTDVTITGDVTDEADNCSTGLQATFTDAVVNGTCPILSTITRTWTLTDDCNNTTTLVQTINVQDNTAPTFTVPADITIECDQDPTDVTITGDVTDEADNCSTGLQATFTDAVVNGTCPILSTITRTWTLTDDCNNTTTLVQTINVQDNTAPTFTVPADITIECDQDPTDVAITGDVTDEADNCSTGLQATFTDAVVNGTCPILSTITRTWTLTDDCNNTTTLVQTINVQDNTAPTFTVPADITIECDQDATDVSVTGDVTDEADNCSTDLEATFTDDVVDGACTNESVITRTWTLTDDCDNTTTLVQTITVQDTTSPTFTVPDDITIECDQDATDVSVTGDVTDEADNCSTDLEATFTDDVVDGACTNESVITRTWTLTDDCDNTTTFIQTITVQDTTSPTFTVPDDITIECDQDATDVSITGDVTDEADNCSTDLEATFTDDVVDGACTNESVITRTWTLTDDCDNTTTFIQTITVQDSTSPTFTVPDDITIDCEQDVTDLSITGDVTDEADNCSTDLEATFTDEVGDGVCPIISTVTRTWTLTDDCDNTTTFIQTISIQDTTAPTLVGELEETINAVCGNIPEIPELVFEDSCSDLLPVEFNETSTFDGTDSDYIIIRDWFVNDTCGNESVFTQTVNVSVENEIPTDTALLCIEDDFEFDLFSLLIGDFNGDGVWTSTTGNAAINGSFFNPSDLLDANGDFTQSQLGDYEFTYTYGGDCPGSATVVITIDDECVVFPCGEDDLIISSGVTVNFDGINEFFTITGVEGCGFVFDLQIFNRWGAKIYENPNYQNDWNGTSSNASIGNSNYVPTGTYFYVLKLKNSGLNPVTGPIYVSTK